MRAIVDRSYLSLPEFQLKTKTNSFFSNVKSDQMQHNEWKKENVYGYMLAMWME